MAIVTDGLVLYLHGACGKNNPATRVWKDLSGNGNDGELVNFGYTEDSGWGDGGLKFDGVDDYVQLPNLGLNPDNFTIQVDNKIRAFNGDKVMTENGDEWGRNLALIKDYSLDNQYQTVTKTDETFNGQPVYRAIKKITSTPPTRIERITIRKGETFTASIWIKHEQQPTIDAARLIFYKDVILKSVYAKNNYGEWERLIVTYTNNTNADIENVSINFYPARGVGEVTYFTCPKIEEGSQATPWTPAPEDITETNIINHTTPFIENNTIHTFRLYNRALTDEEIMQNYQAGYEWTPQIGKREVTTTMKPIITSLSRKGKGKRELISTLKPITTSLERKGKGKREVISTMKPTTSSLSRRGVGRREVTTIIRPITLSISKKLPPIHADMDIRERTPSIATRERIPKLEVD